MKILKPFKHSVLPPEAQMILKDAWVQSQNLKLLSEREEVINRAIAIVRRQWPKYFQDQKKPFDSIGYFVAGWVE